MIQMMKWPYDRIARIDRLITRIEWVTTKASPIWIVALYECKLLLNTTEALHQNFYVRYLMCRLLTNRINAILFHSYNLFARTNVVISTEDTLSHQRSQSRTKHTSAPWHYSPVHGINAGSKPHPNWGLCCQKQVSQAGISNYIPQFTVGCNYLSLSEIPASGNKVHNYTGP